MQGALEAKNRNSVASLSPRFRLWGKVAFGFTGVTKAFPRFTSACRHVISGCWYCRPILPPVFALKKSDKWQMTSNAVRKVLWVFYLRMQIIDSRVAQVIKSERIDIKCQNVRNTTSFLYFSHSFKAEWCTKTALQYFAIISLFVVMTSVKRVRDISISRLLQSHLWMFSSLLFGSPDAEPYVKCRTNTWKQNNYADLTKVSP